MAIRGNLSEANLTDVLQLLALGQKTGCLSVAREGSFGSVHFDSGRIVYAAIVNRQDRLGERLLRSGAISADALARLQTLLNDALVPEIKRRPTKPTRGSTRRRLDGKARRGEAKTGRQRVSPSSS